MKKTVALLIMALCLSLDGFAIDVSSTYRDVYEEKWFFEDVKYVYLGSLMDGVNGAFLPSENTTRGVLIEALYRLEGAPAAQITDRFSDVPPASPYSASVSWAFANGIVGGYGNGKAGVDDPITREQMATIFYRYAGVKGLDLKSGSDLSKYVDEESISAYAREALSWANATGLINGTSDTMLSPQGMTTRSQVAAVVHRLGEKIMGVTYPDTGLFVAAKHETVTEWRLVKESYSSYLTKDGEENTHTYHYDSEGNYTGRTWVLKTHTQAGEHDYWSTHTVELNSDDWPLRRTESSTSPMSSETTYHYDENGVLISADVHYRNERQGDLYYQLDYKDKTTYDAQGRRQTGIELQNRFGDFTYLEYAYAPEGYLQTSTRRGPEANGKTVSTYNAQGEIVQYVYYLDDVAQSACRYEYDVNGLLVRDIFWKDSTGVVDFNDSKHIIVTNYAYDEHGNQIMEYGTRYGLTQFASYDDNSYDEHGNLISVITTIGGHDNQWYLRTYEYQAFTTEK